MTFAAPARRPFRLLRGAAALCAFAVWLLGLLAISPQLHERLHEDGAAPHHECAVTLFQHGAEDPLTFSGLSLAPMAIVAGPTVRFETLARPAADVRLQPGRDPPR